MTTALHTPPEDTRSIPVLDRRMALSLAGLVVALGVLAGAIRLFLGLGPTTNLQDTYSWGIWIGFDFTLIAFSGAGFTMAAVVHVLRRHEYHEAVRPAILAGLMGYVAVLLLLVLDLGRWDRFYNFIIFWNAHSPLFEISWCVLLYTTVLVVESSPFLLERLKRQKLLKLTAVIMLPVTILGVTLSTLHQSTLGTLYLNMPHRLDTLWYTPLLPVLFFTSSVMAGLSLGTLSYMAAARIMGREIKREIVSGLTRAAAIVSLLYLGLKVGELAVSGELPLLFAFDTMSWLMWLELGVGVVLPAVLLLLPSLRHRTWATIVGPLLILFGVLMNRFSATMFAQILPQGTTYVPSLMEWLSTLGVLVAAGLAWYIGIRVLSIFDHGGH